MLAQPNGLALQSFSEKQLEEVGSAFSDLLLARSEERGVDEARSRLTGQIEKLEATGVDLLGKPAELALALGLSAKFASHKNLRGRIQEIQAEAPHLPGGELRLAVRLPNEYDPGDQGWPLVIAVAEQGQRAAEHLREAFDVAGFREGAILVALELPEEELSWEEVSYQGQPGGISRILTALRYADTEFRTDADRIYLAGSKESVPMVFVAASFDPGRFAGVIGRAGDLGELDGVPNPENFLATPAWFGASGSNAKTFIEELESLGGKGSERVAGDDANELWRWLDRNRRDRAAHRVRVKTGDPFPTRVGWLGMTPISKDGFAEGEIDRKANRISIQSKGVAALTLYLNDELLDLDRPFTLDLDGVERELTAKPNLSDVIDLIEDGISDKARLFTAAVYIEPAGPDRVRSLGLPPGRDEEFDLLFKAAGDKVERLWRLAQRWERDGEDARAAVALAKLLRLEPDHAQARKAAGWFGESNKWFRSKEGFERHLASQQPEDAARRGLVEYKDVWIHPTERKLASRGWTKDHSRGQWLTGQDQQRLASGSAIQDFAWIAADQAEFVDRGLWLVGGEWLELEQANQRHRRLGSPWRIPTGSLVLNTTLDRETALLAARQAERALTDARDVLGVQPPLPIEVTVLGREEQVDRFALGEPDGSREPRHVGRVHTLGSAFLAERWFRRVDGELEHFAQGVGLWDPGIENGAAYGLHSVRFAAALSFVEALDPSPMAVRRALSKGVSEDFSAEYYAEKRLPAWLRWGAAVYAERFFLDPDAPAGADPDWPRVWSLQNLAGVGGLSPLDDLFTFDLVAGRDASRRLLISAGAAVAFLVRGENGSAHPALTTFQDEMRAGNLQRDDIERLEQALRENEAALRTFCQT